MNPTRSTKFCCTECGELHDIEEDARLCCAPGVNKVNTWVCAECGDEMCDEEMARYCCLDDDGVLPPTPTQLEAAGQQRLVP